MLSRNLILLFTLLTASNEIAASYEYPSTWNCAIFLSKNNGNQGCDGDYDQDICRAFALACGPSSVSDIYVTKATILLIGVFAALIRCIVTIHPCWTILLCACQRN